MSDKPSRVWSRDTIPLAAVSLVSLALHLIAIRGYGYFRDELYYLACSDHLAFGYVDHPPLSILLLKGVRLVLGDSLFALRLLPALGGALFVVLAGLMARELGGKRPAIFLAAAAAFAPVGNFFLFHIYRRYGLPKASCGHNNYWLWGPPKWNGAVAIILGTSRDFQKSMDDLKPYFQDVIHAATTSSPYAMPYENNRAIFLCRKARFSIQDIWRREKHFI